MIKLNCKKFVGNLVRRMSSKRDPFRLKFDNKVLKTLPIDEVEENYVRNVSGACFSRVKPEPVENPKLVVHSKEALKLIDIDADEATNDENIANFVEYFSGNKFLEGAEPAAHCYCGHQFGVFAGQLGDGAAMYLGEVLNKNNERWELQFKGAGPTPYSRSADGRKVLRSSIREFLCSEAMHALGVPTTRAGTCITSDTKVIRDVFYTGNPIHEKCTVITRIAETFIRFGSFEIFKVMDPMSGRRGPSIGRMDILKQLADYVVETFFPEIWNSDMIDEDKYETWYEDVVKKTARLVAHWQCVGFCHGVLNTDNMSILGLTIDYGPFGFMERFDPDLICNASDENGRYTYVKQPEICKWNLSKFAEALRPLLPLERSIKILNDVYDKEFENFYLSMMRKKLGLTKDLNESANDGQGDKIQSDQELIDNFLKTMKDTGADFTNCFRSLSLMSIPGMIGFEADFEQLHEKLVSLCCSMQELIASNEASVDSRQVQLILMLVQSNPDVLTRLGFTPDSMKAMLDKVEKLRELKKQNPEQKKSSDRELWKLWLQSYVNRLKYDCKDCSSDQDALYDINVNRVKIMNENNPRFVLRNYLAQQAITKAEQGDFSEVQRLHKILQQPFTDAGGSEVGLDDTARLGVYEGQRPEWACTLRVGCSS